MGVGGLGIAAALNKKQSTKNSPQAPASTAKTRARRHKTSKNSKEAVPLSGLDRAAPLVHPDQTSRGAVQAAVLLHESPKMQGGGAYGSSGCDVMAPSAS